MHGHDDDRSNTQPQARSARWIRLTLACIAAAEVLAGVASLQIDLYNGGTCL